MWFVFVFFTLYAAMHIYIYAAAARAFSWGAPVGAVVALFLVLMTCAPLLTYRLEKRGWDAAARISAWVGYTWMGTVVFVLLSRAGGGLL